ncbi:MAG TPA: hypothetical protein VEA40_21840 [Ramlibacter sp.]|nr:hypothetical protein [Ramlibacter sp.]
MPGPLTLEPAAQVTRARGDGKAAGALGGLFPFERLNERGKWWQPRESRG